YSRYPNRKLTPAATSIRLRRNENNCYAVSGHHRTPSAPNLRCDIPVNYQHDRQEDDLFKYHRPRQLLRRKDSIQAAPPHILSEDRSLYKSTFTGQMGPRPSRVQPREQGINGLETAQQKVKSLLESKDLTHITEDVYKQIYPLPNDSTYNTDFNEHIFQDVYSENTLPNINSKMQDNSTDYRENYHSWIKPSRNDGIMQRIGQKACYSAIQADKLLNSFDGRQERIPKTLYRDSFIGLHNVDNWSDRHILQNSSSVTSR
ncbi:unnamed protein product, partial [Schistosoma curassoni]|uniref:Erbb2 interacting protein n=1 Tax=Schistosoma curassoni TaxID=6186 RepID=A0A183L309_9TREM